MCLRTGTESPDLLWQAGVRAVTLGRHESALTYLDRLEEVEPGRPWANYYRGISLLALNRNDEAIAAANSEGERIEKPGALHLQSICALASAQSDRLDDVRQHLTAALAVPLKSIDELSIPGILACHDRLMSASSKLPPDDRVREKVIDRLLSSGLTPDGFWDAHRAKSGAPVADLKHFVCDVGQQLGAKWADSPECPPGWDEWPAYLVRYGVLAKDEDDARQNRSALANAIVRWQSRGAGDHAPRVGRTRIARE